MKKLAGLISPVLILVILLFACPTVIQASEECPVIISADGDGGTPDPVEVIDVNWTVKLQIGLDEIIKIIDLERPADPVYAVIYGSSGFNVHKINFKTVTLAGAPCNSQVRYRDDNADGIPDVVLTFKSGGMSIPQGLSSAVLKGMTLDSQEFSGADFVIGSRPGQVYRIVTCDEFFRKNHIVQNIQLPPQGMLTVILCSIGSTGFRWTDQAGISDPCLVQQIDHYNVTPPAGIITGGSGFDVWSFNVLGKGSSILTFEYGQPWPGGQQRAWTCELILNIK